MIQCQVCKKWRVNANELLNHVCSGIPYFIEARMTDQQRLENYRRC